MVTWRMPGVVIGSGSYKSCFPRMPACCKVDGPVVPMVQKRAVLGGCQVVFVMCSASVVHKEAVINDTDGKFACGTAMGPSGRPVWLLGPLVDTSNKIVLTKTRKSENKRGNT
jgi:hypothetical protein